jgi:glucans biosynthesis protein
VLRRQFLVGCGATLVAMGAPESAALAQTGARMRFGPPSPFDFDRLRARARALAARPPRPLPMPARQLVARLDYDAYQRIRPRADAVLWPDRPDAPPVRFFHLGRHNPHPIRIQVVEDGRARELRYDRSLFEYGDRELARRIPRDLGFGGFRVMHGGDDPRDWLAFSGASYFRSSGQLDQYGQSARGIAIGTGLPEPEEFPRFSEIWLAPAPEPDVDLTIYALLEGVSLTGAYAFRCTRDRAVGVDVDVALFPRGPIPRLGVAPLTRLFWYSETDRRRASDWRLEIHDTDGLAMWTGAGERVWRPLRNPSVVRVHTYRDRDPRGFGLSQRDRLFDHYQDDGVFYDRRPSVWIEPRGAWGEGEVMLVEIPTDDEIFDNIVAFWHPARRTARGDELRYAYRMCWAAAIPSFPAGTARVVATRSGRAGVPGQPRPRDGLKYVIDFEGGALARLRREDGVTPVATASRGRIERAYALPIVGTQRWRAAFDVFAEGDEAVELRCFLRHGEDALTETWSYPHMPSA